jgi:uncharacterized membrane protein YjjB (DUF3815 family)
MLIDELFIKSFWSGVAGIGFAILFNVPKRTLIAIFILGLLGGVIKFGSLYSGMGIVFATFLSASVVGFLSIQTAHWMKSPPMIFSIPAVIPMVPGLLAYKMMLGVISLSNLENSEVYLINLIETVNNGVKSILILIAIAIGVSIPMLLTRKESMKSSESKKGNS